MEKLSDKFTTADLSVFASEIADSVTNVREPITITIMSGDEVVSTQEVQRKSKRGFQLWDPVTDKKVNLVKWLRSTFNNIDFAGCQVVVDLGALDLYLDIQAKTFKAKFSFSEWFANIKKRRLAKKAIKSAADEQPVKYIFKAGRKVAALDSNKTITYKID